MQKNNFLIYQFFRGWHADSDGKDIFISQNVPFGFSFRIDIWNDFVFYLRTRICLSKLCDTNFKKLYVGVEKSWVELILKEIGLPFSRIQKNKFSKPPGYYFPIFRYMDEHSRSWMLKSRLKDLWIIALGSLMPLFDKLFVRCAQGVFIQEYHPTRKILVNLRDASKVRVVLARISSTIGWTRYFTERPIPVWGRLSKYQQQAEELIQRFRIKRAAKLILVNGDDVSESVYRVIEEKIAPLLPDRLRTLDCVNRYLDKNPIDLEVLIANLGKVPMLVDCVCKHRGIPSYMIINGLLTSPHQDESKFATVINAYSDSIKENYFRGMDNIVCLGDPRMDSYIPLSPRRIISEKIPTITVGASGFNPVDLNSYVAVEFDFLYDVLEAFKICKEQGDKFRIVIKVRPNGYREQYERFVTEYFSDLVDEIIDMVPMRDVLKETDFYISIYSQTLFEASCMGIPALYYKKDNEIMDPPFDGRSELVTVDNVNDLVAAIADFQAGSKRFDTFLQKSVMEKYVGPLDGGNVDRNIHFIEELLKKHYEGDSGVQ